MADSRAAKILSPAHRETALCRVLPFVKKTAECNAEWDAAVHQLHRLGVCTSCPGLPPPYLLACLPACLPHRPWITFCKSGGHQVSGAEPAESLKVLDGHEPADI